jgi:hypothetical protein
MKPTIYAAGIATALLIASGICFQRMNAVAANPAQRFEYVTVRWAGRENMHVIRHGGKVEMAWPQLNGVKKPERADERSFYMNIVVNALAKENYAVVGMTSDEILMGRSVTQ